jgi:hypothetical protein
MGQSRPPLVSSPRLDHVLGGTPAATPAAACPASTGRTVVPPTPTSAAAAAAVKVAATIFARMESDFIMSSVNDAVRSATKAARCFYSDERSPPAVGRFHTAFVNARARRRTDGDRNSAFRLAFH